MASKGGGGGVQGIPAASRKMVQSLKEIVNGVSDVEIYSALKDCNMDPNEAVNRLLSQDPFHEVKSKREKKKELKDTSESRPRGGGSTSSRGARSGTERSTGRGGSSQYSASESGGLHGKSKRENGTSSSAPAYGVAANFTNRAPPSYSGSTGYENKSPTFNVADGTAPISQQSSSGYQSAWSNAPGQKSMADIVKMGRPQNKLYTDPVSSQPPSTHYEVHQQPDVSPDDDWPVMEQPQTVGAQSILEPHVESENVGQSYEEDNNQDIGSHVDQAQAEDENVVEDQTANYAPNTNIQVDTSESAPLYGNDSYKNIDSFHIEEDHAFEHKQVEEGDVSASSISANIQQLNIHEERPQLDEPEEDVPCVVIPDHLQVSNSDCAHLSFGSFGATNMNPTLHASFGSQQLRSKMEDVHGEADTSPVGPSDTRNDEYYDDEPVISERNQVHRMGPSSGSYDLPSVSQTEVLKQENSEMNQYSFPSSTAGPGYTFDGSQLLNQSFPQSQTPTQMPNAPSFSNVMQQAAYTNSLPSTLSAANGHPVRESDLSYSPLLANQSTPSKYGSSIGASTVSISEALKTGIFSSSSQTTQQTSPGNAIPTGPGVQQHVVHPYSQPTLPLGAYANMIGYPFLPPQSYTYMPSGFQQAFAAAAAGNNTYHQQLGAAGVVPQYKNSVSVSSLPHSATSVPSGYSSFGNSTSIPGHYQANNQPSAGSNISYDDALNAHFKETSQLLSLQHQQQQQQQNENSAMWVHGGGSRTMPAVPASTYYGFHGQNQQASGFRQGQQQQQPSQSYGGAAALNYQNYYQSQTGISQEHQLQQNARDGSQSQPKPQQQSQQLWQNSY